MEDDLMARTVALLLDDPDNRYQELLRREARRAGDRAGVEILEPEYARGSSWTQVESTNRLLRDARPDAIVVILSGRQWTRAPFERVVKAGVPVVLLNRIPEWVEDLRRDHPRALVAGVTPDQEGIGRIQASQGLRLARPGSFVLLVTGDASSPAAVFRRRGFLDEVADRFTVREVDGRWTAAGAERACQDWFRFGAERDRAIDLVVCQNDAMAGGVQKALAKRTAGAALGAGARTLLIGCDGLDREGKAMVARGELAATVVMPPTTPAAIEILGRYWETGATTGTQVLDAASYPALDALCPA
jgi:ABC-type sugar transport system substrate-binding protein